MNTTNSTSRQQDIIKIHWLLRWPLWVLYGSLIRLRLGWRALIQGYKRERDDNSDWDWVRRSGMVCIVVGGLSVGGSGKTPLVDVLLGWISQRGWRAVCLSRGYRRQVRARSLRACMSEDDNSYWRKNPASWLGDEVAMLATKHDLLPFYVGADRGFNLRTAVLRDAPQVAVLDDAFQHVAFVREGGGRDEPKRRLNVLIWDASQPLKEARLLPRGELREPLWAAHRADVLLLTRSDDDNIPLRRAEWQAQGLKIPIFHCDAEQLRLSDLQDEQSYPLSTLKGLEVGSWCGIAHPEHLEHSLKRLGANIIARYYFPNHHSYTNKDLEHLRQLSKERVWVITAKDAVKLKNLLRSSQANYSRANYSQANYSQAGVSQKLLAEKILVLHLTLQPQKAFLDFLLEFLKRCGLK